MGKGDLFLGAPEQSIGGHREHRPNDPEARGAPMPYGPHALWPSRTQRTRLADHLTYSQKRRRPQGEERTRACRASPMKGCHSPQLAQSTLRDRQVHRPQAPCYRANLNARRRVTEIVEPSIRPLSFMAARSFPPEVF